jgi:hypothetical protein
MPSPCHAHTHAQAALSAAAAALVTALEAVVRRLTRPARGGDACEETDGELSPHPPSSTSLSSLLLGFDAAWARYLDQFSAWKSADAAALEADLVAMAVAMHASLARKCGAAAAAAATARAGDDAPAAAAIAALSHDRGAMVRQVREDVALLQERVRALSGEAGATRLRAALDAVASDAAAAEDTRAADAAAAAASAAAAAADAAAHANERIMHELMHGHGGRHGFAGGGDDAGDDARGGPEEEDDDEEEQAAAADDSEGSSDGPDAPLTPRGVAKRVRATLRRAFWDGVAASVAPVMSQPTAGADTPPAAPEATPATASENTSQSGDAPPPAYYALMLELRTELLTLAPPSRAAPLGAALHAGADGVRDALTRGADAAAAAPRLRAFVGAAAGALRALGAPTREAAFDAALARLEAAAAAAQASDAAAASLGAVVASALRLLFAQLTRLKRDVASAARAALAPTARGAAGAAWAARRFAQRHALPPPAAPSALPLPPAALPRTRAFLAGAAASLPGITAELGAAMCARAGGDAGAVTPRGGASSPRSPGLASPTAGFAAPAAMHTGRGRATPLTPRRAAQPPLPAPPACPGVASLRSAPALLRAGIVAAVAAAAAAAAEVDEDALPETLAFDARRVSECAAAFERCVVTAAAFMLLPQLRDASSSPSSPSPPAADASSSEALRERLAALLADGTLRLSHVATEVARAAGPAADAAAAERALARLTSRDAPPRLAIDAALGAALRAHLLLGDTASGGGGGAAAAAAALRRCGAGAAAALGGDVAALAARLERVAAVSERVHGAWYDRLAAPLLLAQPLQ